jgi:hypothetical protein
MRRQRNVRQAAVETAGKVQGINDQAGKLSALAAH